MTQERRASAQHQRKLNWHYNPDPPDAPANVLPPGLGSSQQHAGQPQSREQLQTQVDRLETKVDALEAKVGNKVDALGAKLDLIAAKLDEQPPPISLSLSPALFPALSPAF